MILCLGEALVDLICERRVRSFAEADSFRPHFGGALANVAVAASRAGAHAGLAAAVGDDEWGRWLRERLEREGVDLRFFELLHGQQTPIAFARFDRAGEPSFEIYGDAVEAVGPRVGDAVAAASALVFSSTTLATPGEREVTLRARELALAGGVGSVSIRTSARTAGAVRPAPRRGLRGSWSRARSWSGPTATRRWRSRPPTTRAPRRTSWPRWAPSSRW